MRWTRILRFEQAAIFAGKRFVEGLKKCERRE
jgi:hypothetical protein